MDKKTQQSIAAQVRAERKRRKLNQKELAEMVGIAPNTVGGLERGITFPQRPHLRAILSALDLTHLLDDTTDSEVRPLIDDGGWSPDVKVALNMIGLYLEGLTEVERDRRIRDITLSIINRDL